MPVLNLDRQAAYLRINPDCAGRSHRWPCRLVAFLLLTAAAQSTAGKVENVAQLDGWWAATLVHGSETRSFYLHFVRKTDKGLVATLTIPEIGARDTSPLPARVDDDGKGLLVGHWHLLFGNNGQSLEGKMPHSLAPYYELNAQVHEDGQGAPGFRRTGA